MKNKNKANQELKVLYVPTSSLRPAPYNPRSWDKEAVKNLKESIRGFGIVDPLLVNSAPNRKNIVIGGHFRLDVIKELGLKEVPVVFINIPEENKERQLNIRLNKNTGQFDWDLLAKFDEKFLSDVGFSSEELDKVFEADETPEVFDLKKELAKLDIKKIKAKTGDVYDLNGSRLMVGDSTIEADVLTLMEGHEADMCFTDPPYLLDYLKGKKKKNGDVTKGFGLKRDRVYLGTETLPDNFTELWMNNVVKIQKPDFSIIVYENPKNLKTIWLELEKRWKYRNTIIWHIRNRVQGFSAKYKFFNKYDFAIVGTSGKVGLNVQPESDALLQTEYETALFATSGKPHWESYGKGKKYCPTDHIEHVAADEKSSGQGVIFGTKPLEILIPYIKILTKRGDLIFEPYSGSGSTLIAAVKMQRRCFGMEKSPVYTEIILRRWSKLTGLSLKKFMKAKQRKTVDARIKKEKEKFLEILEKNPVVQIACERSGVSKATFYRWKEIDKEFNEKAGKAVTEGNSLITDIAISQLISAVKDKNLGAIKFWLEKHSEEYGNELHITTEIEQEITLSLEQETQVRRGLELISLLNKQNHGN